VDLEKAVANLAQRVERRFYGKYRGLVVDNHDPESLGRLTLRVPSVLGPEVVTGWALPCVPYGGDPNQGFLCIPEPGAGVWVEFEEGDVEFPIWVGTFWSKPGGHSELPKPNHADGSEQGSVQSPPTRKIIKTRKGHTIQFEDADGEELVIIVEATHEHVVTLNKDGIQISDGVHGNKIIMGAQGIQIGSSAATEPFVLGQQFLMNVMSFITALNAHTHALTPTGAILPPSPPIPPLQVPLSMKHRVE
jgi:uncharacterized protein involved in type VI secretion and phage assembly